MDISSRVVNSRTAEAAHVEILGGEKQRAVLFAPASFICGTGFCQTPQGTRSSFSFFLFVFCSLVVVRHLSVIPSPQYRLDK